MQKRKLGNSGLDVSVVGLGCNNFGARIDAAQARQVVAKALDLGINFFDTADVYGSHFGTTGYAGASEEFLGQALGARRQEAVVCTKFGVQMAGSPRVASASRQYIMAAVEDSLRRLKTDWIDVYQLHRPFADVPVEETLRALDDLVRQGKVRYIACSKFTGWRLAEAEWTSRSVGLNRFIAAEDEYSLLARTPEIDLFPAMKQYNIGLIPYSPLAAGQLTGKYRANAAPPAGTRFAVGEGLVGRFNTPENWARVDKLQVFAREGGHSVLDLAMSWLVHQPVVGTIIAGATSPEQVEQNVAAAMAWKLTAAELAEIDKICPPGTGVPSGRS